MRSLVIASIFLGIAAMTKAGELKPLSLPKYVTEVESRLSKGEKLTVRKVDLETGTDGGGEVTFYSKGGSPWKMVISVGLSNRIEEQTFFYVDGKLVLLVEDKRYFRYDSKKETLDLTKFSREEESRYYFKDGELVYWITSNDWTAVLNTESNIQNKVMDDKKTEMADVVKSLKDIPSTKAGISVDAFIKGLPR